MARWLVKSDPDTYSFADLVRDRTTTWDGVANAAALGHLAPDEAGRRLLVYETGDVKAIVGRAKVVSAPKADPDDPKLATVELAAGGAVARPLTLAAIKADPAFAGWELVRISRLSVMPVPEPIWQRIETTDPRLNVPVTLIGKRARQIRRRRPAAEPPRTERRASRARRPRSGS